MSKIEPTPGPWTIHEWPGENRAWSIDSKDHKGFIIIYDLDDINNEANAIQVGQSPDILADCDRLKALLKTALQVIDAHASRIVRESCECRAIRREVFND